MKFLKISQYRTEMMGIAILSIMLFHSEVYFGNFIGFLPLAFIKEIGYAGVDLFFFLSGFGLSCSWFTKKYKILDFYKRRLAKIIPTYWIVILIVFLLNSNDFSWHAFIWKMSALDFFRSNSGYWFIYAIIICYIFFPLLAKLIEKETSLEGINRLTINAISIAILTSLILTQTKLNHILIFTSRVPIFILGTYIGYLFIKKINNNFLQSKRIQILLLTTGFIFVQITFFIIPPGLRWHYGLFWYPFLLITFPLASFLSFLLEYLSNKNAKFVTIFLIFCGSNSLEIYLLHEIIFSYCEKIISSMENYYESINFVNSGNVLQFLISVAITLFLAPYLKKIVNILNYKFNLNVPKWN